MLAFAIIFWWESQGVGWLPWLEALLGQIAWLLLGAVAGLSPGATAALLLGSLETRLQHWGIPLPASWQSPDTVPRVRAMHPGMMAIH